MLIPDDLQVFAFIMSGITLKAADYWGELGNPFTAHLLALLTALLFGILASQDLVNSALIFGILAGVIFAQKVDRKNLVIGVVATLIFAVVFHAEFPPLWLVVIVAAAAYLDELLHDRKMDTHGWQGMVFQFRLVLKLVVVGLSIATWIPYQTVLHLLGFDLAYEGTNYVLTQKRRE